MARAYETRWVRPDLVAAGTAFFNAEEIARFRDYLLKGGFVFVSDYWGPIGQRQFDDQMSCCTA